MDYIDTKTILTRVKSNDSLWFHADYNINLYRGCSFGCVYCDSRSICYGIEDFDKVKAKRNAIEILEKELSSKRKVGVCTLGAMSDPYNPLEKELELTRKSLQLLKKYGFGVVIVTKSNLVIRDIELLKQMNEFLPVLVNFTITTSNPHLKAIIEPNSPSNEERFEAIEQLSKAKIKTGITMMPLLPFINDNEDNLNAIIKEASKRQAHHIYAHFGVTLRDRQRDYYYSFLKNNFPELILEYEKYYQNSYYCNSKKANVLINLLQKTAKPLGILTDIQEINKSFYRVPEQLSLDF